MILKGKVALVTGASRGIGKAIAEAFLKEGCTVIFTATKAQGLRHAKAMGWPLDLSDDSSLDQFVLRMRALRRLDILVNNAGINIISPVEKIRQEDWNKVLKVNLTGAMRLTQEAVRLMKKSKNGGHILNVSSIFGVISKAYRNAYSASKAGLIGFTHSSSLELASDRILVNALCPGFVLTDLTKKILKPQERKQMAAQVPMGRFADPKEIAQAALFLCSPKNTYMTGQTLVVDGGFSVQ